MADSDTTAISVLAPEVRTLARPGSGPLLAARGVSQRLDAARAAYLRAREEGWTGTQLGEALFPIFREQIEGSEDEVRAAALYLADEYLQIGDAMLLVDHVTGRAVARITEADIWQPPDVPREHGGMATPLPRIRPDLEAFLYQHVHKRAHEVEIQAQLAARGKQTAFLATEGDRRFQISSRAGRNQITESLQALDNSILESAIGTTRQFFQFFESRAQTWLEATLSGTLMARTRMSLTDFLAINYRYNHAGSRHLSLVQDWARELARTVGRLSHQEIRPRSVAFEDLTAEHLQGACFWIVAPEMAAAFYRFPGVSVFTIEGVSPVGFLAETVGAFEIRPGSLEVQDREMIDWWEILGQFDYTLSLDHAQIVTLDVTDCPVQVHVMGPHDP